MSASIPILNRSWTLTRVLAIVVLIAFIIAAYAIPLSLHYRAVAIILMVYVIYLRFAMRGK